VKHLAEIAEALMAGGRDGADRVTIISNATLPQQSVAQTSLREAKAFVVENEIATPAIVVLGDVAEWRAVLDWYRGGLRENPIG
jgi:uroporphyrin-III C-methyltransferase